MLLMKIKLMSTLVIKLMHIDVIDVKVFLV